MLEATNETRNLILIPGIRRATIKMISEQYKIPYAKLSNRYNWNKKQFEGEVIIPKTKEEFENMIDDKIQFVCKSEYGMTGYLFTNAAFASIKFGSTPLFSEKAAKDLIEMSNKDNRGHKKSSVSKPKPEKIEKKAEEVVLDFDVPDKEGTNTGKLHVEVPIAQTDIFDTQEEELLIGNLAKAFKSGETMNMLTAALALDEYRRREIKELKATTQKSAMSWTNRASAEKVASMLGYATNESKYEAWCRIYDCLLNDYNVDLRARGKRPLINGLKDTEWHLFYQVFYDICRAKYLDSSHILEDAGIDISGLSVVIKYPEMKVKA